MDISPPNGGDADRPHPVLTGAAVMHEAGEQRTALQIPPWGSVPSGSFNVCRCGEQAGWRQTVSGCNTSGYRGQIPRT